MVGGPVNDETAAIEFANYSTNVGVKTWAEGLVYGRHSPLG